MANVDKKLVRQVYRFLLQKAMLGHTTTYSDIGVKFGLPARGHALGTVLSPVLSEIFEFCKRRGQPHLTSIVVRKSGADEGLPGGGFWTLALDLENDRVIAKEFNRVGSGLKTILTEAYQKQVFDYWSI